MHFAGLIFLSSQSGAADEETQTFTSLSSARGSVAPHPILPAALGAILSIRRTGGSRARPSRFSQAPFGMAPRLRCSAPNPRLRAVRLRAAT